MKYKLDENGNIVLKDGHPVLVDDDGKEFVVDAIGANQKIRELMAEAKGYRTKASERKTELAKFDGIEDPAAAISAMETVATMDDKHKADIDALKGNINKTWQEKLDAKDTELAEVKSNLYKATVTSQFATSPVVKKLILPPDIAAEYFGKFFKADGTAVDPTGNVILSKEKPGDPASFDEALEHLIDAYPNKESILKGSGAHGSGNHSGNDGGESGGEKSSSDLISAGLKERGIT